MFRIGRLLQSGFLPFRLLLRSRAFIRFLLFKCGALRFHLRLKRAETAFFVPTAAKGLGSRNQRIQLVLPGGGQIHFRLQ